MTHLCLPVYVYFYRHVVERNNLLQLKAGVYHQGPTTFGLMKGGCYEPKSDISIRLKAFVNAGGKNTGFVAKVTRDFDGLCHTLYHLLLTLVYT